MKDIPRRIRKAVLKRAGGPYCENIIDGKRCRRQVIPYGGVHHIIPKSLGGEDSEANCQVRCVRCHQELGHGQKVNMDAQLDWRGRL